MPRIKSPQALPVLPAAPAQKAPDHPIEILLAWAVPVKNRRILIAYAQGADPSNPNNLVTVNVRENFNFMLNMRLRVKKVAAGVYDLVGPLPRWRGRW